MPLKRTAFRTGKEWAGVWTRDISYSIILSMAYLQPKVAMNSLMKKSTPTKELSRIREPAARIRALPTVSFGRRRLGKFTKPQEAKTGSKRLTPLSKIR
jgi:hypothetical protein